MIYFKSFLCVHLDRTSDLNDEDNIVRTCHRLQTQVYEMEVSSYNKEYIPIVFTAITLHSYAPKLERMHAHLINENILLSRWCPLYCPWQRFLNDYGMIWVGDGESCDPACQQEGEEAEHIQAQSSERALWQPGRRASAYPHLSSVDIGLMKASQNIQLVQL